MKIAILILALYKFYYYYYGSTNVWMPRVKIKSFGWAANRNQLIGRESGARFFSQSQTVAMQNQSNCEITSDTQLKTALHYLNEHPR